MTQWMVWFGLSIPNLLRFYYFTMAPALAARTHEVIPPQSQALDIGLKPSDVLAGYDGKPVGLLGRPAAPDRALPAPALCWTSALRERRLSRP